MNRIAAFILCRLDAGNKFRFQDFSKRLVSCLARDPLRGQHVVDCPSVLVPSLMMFVRRHERLTPNNFE